MKLTGFSVVFMLLTLKLSRICKHLDSKVEFPRISFRCFLTAVRPGTQYTDTAGGLTHVFDEISVKFFYPRPTGGKRSSTRCSNRTRNLWKNLSWHSKRSTSCNKGYQQVKLSNRFRFEAETIVEDSDFEEIIIAFKPHSSLYKEIFTA